MSGRAVAEHPLLHRLCQPHSRGLWVPLEGFRSTWISRWLTLTRSEKRQIKQKGSFSLHKLPNCNKPCLLLAAVRPGRGWGCSVNGQLGGGCPGRSLL